MLTRSDRLLILTAYLVKGVLRISSGIHNSKCGYG